MPKDPDTLPETLSSLKRRAFDLRIDNLTAITAAASGHPGGTLSAMDIMQALFFGEMRHRPAEPHWPDRDRFVLSKGHAVPALYTVLAHAGYFSRDLLPTLRRLGSPLQGHPANFITPGIEASTGSLGQGFSVAIGMALAAKLDRSADGDKFRVYALIGDGESQEGQIWEAAMAAPKYALDNLVVILDHNKGQIDGFVDEVMSLNPIADKWRAFNGKPTFILAETVKGKGVSFMEGKVGWHGVAPTQAQLEDAVKELRAAKATFEASVGAVGGGN
jgi:transketolase